jgi:benzoate-CoA ligase family protein
MREHTVELSPDAQGSRILLSSTFNVAVPFIDRHPAEGRGDRVAIRTADGRTITYAELARECDRWARTLQELGFAPGDRQLMIVLDCPEFFYFFWGAIKVGVVPIPVNTLLRAKDYRYMVEDSGARAVLWSPELAAEVEPALAGAATKPEIAFDVPAAMTRAMRTAPAPGPLAPHASAPLDDCFWLYSSGSTGFPKGAVHAHRDLVTVSQRYGVETLGVGAADVCYSAAKLFFAYGLGNSMAFPLWVGASSVLSPVRPTPELTFDLIERFRPTLYFGVPTLYAGQLAVLDRAHATPDLRAPDLSSLRSCVSAGEALPAALLARFRERTGLVILDGIGSTEALHIFIANTPRDWKPGTSGRPVRGYEARIVDDGGGAVERGVSGTLHIRGESTAKYYWGKPEKTRETMLADGWLATGDTYRQDDDGYYVYEGRADDMMKVGGIWTSPVEIEARLVEHPAVLEAAVVGRPDESELFKPEAWIVLKDPAAGAGAERRAALERELLAHVKAALAPYKYPRWWRFVPELPKTATGKIQRYKLRQPAPAEADRALSSDRLET